MGDYTISTNSTGGGPAPPTERKILHLALKNTFTSNVGSVFPPQQFYFDTLRHYPDPTVMDYAKSLGRVTLFEEGTYLVEASIVCQIEGDTNPVSTLTWYVIDDFNAPSIIYLTISSRNSGIDKTLTHTARTLIKVPKGPAKTLDFAVAIDDPVPIELISVLGNTFTGADEYLSNITIEKVSDNVLTDLDVAPPP